MLARQVLWSQLGTGHLYFSIISNYLQSTKAFGEERHSDSPISDLNLPWCNLLPANIFPWCLGSHRPLWMIFYHRRMRVRHWRGITWQSWCLKSPVTRRFVQQFVDDFKENAKSNHIMDPLCEEITSDWWILLTKGPVMRKALPYRDIAWHCNVLRHFTNGLGADNSNPLKIRVALKGKHHPIMSQFSHVMAA